MIHSRRVTGSEGCSFSSIIVYQGCEGVIMVNREYFLMLFLPQNHLRIIVGPVWLFPGHDGTTLCLINFII